jgi:hypothetical protein
VGLYAELAAARTRYTGPNYEGVGGSFSLGSTAPQVTPHYAPRRVAGKDEGGFFGSVGDVLGKARDVGTGVLTGLYNVGAAGVHDLVHPVATAEGHSHLWSNVVHPIIESYRYKYGGAFHGDLGETGHRINEDKLGSLLDLLSIVTLPFTGGGSAAIRGVGLVRVADMIDAARTTRSIAALTQEGADAGAALERGGLVQGELRQGRLGATRHGGELRGLRATAEQLDQGFALRHELRPARTPHWRAAQYAIDQLSMRMPATFHLGDMELGNPLSAAQRIARRSAGDVLNDGTDLAAKRLSRKFSNSLRRLSGPELYAFHLVAEHTLPEERLQMLETSQAMRASRSTARAIEGIRGSMDDVHEVLRNSHRHPEFLHAVELGREVSETASRLLEEMGRLSPEAREARKYLPARVVRGTRWEERRIIKGRKKLDEHVAERRAAERDVEDRKRQIRRMLSDLGIQREKLRQRGKEVPTLRRFRHPDVRRPPSGADHPLTDSMALEIERATRKAADARAEHERQLGHYEGAQKLADNAAAELDRQGGRAARQAATEAAKHASAQSSVAREAMRKARENWERARHQLAQAQAHSRQHFEDDAERARAEQRVAELEAKVERRANEHESAVERFSASHGVHAGAKGALAPHRSAHVAHRAAARDSKAARRIHLNAQRDLYRAQRELDAAERKWSAWAARKGHAVGRHAEQAQKVTELEDGILAAQEALNEARARLYEVPRPPRGKEADTVIEAGFHGGPTQEAIKAELDRWASFGKPGHASIDPTYGGPFRFTHIATREGRRAEGGVARSATGLSQIRTPGFLRPFHATRMLLGTLVTHPEVLSRDLLGTLRYREVHLMQDWLRDYAVRLDHDLPGGLREGYVYFNPGGVNLPRIVKEEAGLIEGHDQITAAFANNAELQDAISSAVERVLPKSEEAAQIRRATLGAAHDDPGALMQVPAWAADRFRREFRSSHALVRNFIDKPMDVWRALVLNYRPAWLVNNIIGQNLLYWLHYMGPQGLRAYMDTLRMEQVKVGPEGKPLYALQHRRFMGQVTRTLGIKRYQRAYVKIFEEATPYAAGIMQGGPSNVAARLTERGIVGEGGQLAERIAHRAHALNAFGRMMQWANLNIADDMTRMAALRRELERSEKFHEAAKQLGDWHSTLGIVQRQLDKMLPEVAGGRHVRRALGLGDSLQHFAEVIGKLDEGEIRRAIESVDRNLGNFKRLSATERDYLRRLVPFYSWFKVIAALSLRLAVDDPVRVNLIRNLEIAAARNPDMIPAGELPSYLDAAIPLHRGDKAGEQSYLSTTALNPFQTIAQLTGTGEATFGPGGTGATNILSLASPAFALGFQVAGIDPFYGGQYKGTGSGHAVTRAAAFGFSLPEGRLLQQLGIAQHIPGVKPYTSRLYDQRTYRIGGVPLWQDYLSNYLGLPIKRVVTAEAETRARAGQ